ncbi:MAG: DUF445 family protein [Leptospira sp.]|nr:DUF445 family protein [Leptospira sp.]NCS95029.1 DUF445 family protein [Leptospira sp.]
MMPFTYGFVGWITNWLALKMTFYPLQFWGIPPYIGWQGIIPRKAHKMAIKAVDVITDKLMNVEEVFARIDPKKFENELYPLLADSIQESTEVFGRSINFEMWNSLPKIIHEEIAYKVERASRATIRNVILKLRNQIESYLDLKGIVLHCLTGSNVGLIVDVFQKVGKPEFKFIERSGFYFGFLLGMLQLVFWLIYPVSWSIPIQGIIVGYLTNYLAINMIFRPLVPKVYFGLFSYQGLFLKRQTEVSQEYSKIVAEKILTPKNILQDILRGAKSEEFISLIDSSVSAQIDRLTLLAKPILFTTGKMEKFNLLKKELSNRMLESILNSLEEIEPFFEQALDLERTMADKMSKLSAQEFESVLRSAFQEDELLLILVGALLGAFVGLGQLFFLVS